MTVKKSYNVGDTVWIYGVDQRNNKIKKGTVVKKFTIDYDGFNDETQYVIAIPTEIEYLLELRTWHNISQDEQGPVGSFREVVQDIASTKKLLSRTGLTLETENQDETVNEDDEISADLIHAALEKSQKDGAHQPFNLKETKKPRRRFVKKKPKND